MAASAFVHCTQVLLSEMLSMAVAGQAVSTETWLNFLRAEPHPVTTAWKSLALSWDKCHSK